MEGSIRDEIHFKTKGPKRKPHVGVSATRAYLKTTLAGLAPIPAGCTIPIRLANVRHVA
jgi:hypothetical protein